MTESLSSGGSGGGGGGGDVNGGENPGRGGSPSGADLLGIYLNDHLVGATAATERIRQMIKVCPDPDLVVALGPLAEDIAEDRVALVRLMRHLGLPVRRYKVWAGRVAERAGRLKTNGRLVSRSPLSTLWELEALRLGVEGKAAAWESLCIAADTDRRIDRRVDRRLLDDLGERARRQSALLEDLRRKQAGDTFRD